MPASTNGGEGSDPAAKTLTLKSPFGSLSKVYDWPLKKGRGSMKKSEDKEDEAAEIVETIKYVCEDHPEVKETMTTSGILIKSNPESFESMQALCNVYNKAIDKMISTKGLPMIKRRKGRANRPHLKHIMQQCYNKSVDDPNELNHYEPFTPEVYGETSFELICRILDRLHPISEDGGFIDLGSGVGQVVLQVAALTNCKLCLGIEKAKAPSKFAREMTKNFEFWMEFYGKGYSKFVLTEGDFLDAKYREDILASTIIFVNNFAFGPEVDQRLKDIFADLIDGSRIFSSKSFCALNFRITDRNLSDIGTIMHVSKMDPLKGSVSWTGKPVSYYLHIIDRAKLERYFQKSAARKEGEESKRGRRSGRHAVAALDESSSGSRDDSRASSIEHDDTTRDSTLSGTRAWNTDPGTRNASDEETRAAASSSSLDPNSRIGGTVLRRGQRKGRRSIAKKQSSSDESTPPQVDLSSGHQTDSNSSTPPLSGSEGGSATRPVRAVVANAAAISVAQQDMNQISSKNRGRQKKPELPAVLPPPVASGSNSTGRKKLIRPQAMSSTSALDLLHQATMDSITASNRDTTAPSGCVNVRLQIDNPPELTHEELPVSLNTDDKGNEIPIALRMYLEKIKKDCMKFMEHMQTSDYKDDILSKYDLENKKKAELLKREKQLKSQIENLIGDSLALLKRRLDELGIQAKTPPEFIEKAKMIVCQHHELQRTKVSLEAEIATLEKEQPKIAVSKESELADEAIKNTGMSRAQAKALARREVDAIVNKKTMNGPKNHQILGLSPEVIVTKCPADQLPSSTQIRKRPRDLAGKQKDWPEKRQKDNVGGSPVKAVPIPSAQDFPTEKIEEKNPEVLAKKIIEQGRNLERSKSMMSPHPMAQRQPTQSVEVRKIEAPVSIHQQQHHHQQQQQQPATSSFVKSHPAPPQAHEAARYEHRQMQNNMVDLPKMDINMSMASMGALNDPPLVLPPHPPSRSASSDPNDDLTFASQKMSSTPRAEQFEDRLKTIIQSVLSGDQERELQPPLALPSRSNGTPPTMQQQSRPMFSPVKKDLPSHLPPPPSGVVITPTSLPQFHAREMASPVKRAADLSAYPQTSSSRTMNDLIASEIEKSLTGVAPAGPKSYHNEYRPGGPFAGLPGKIRPPSPPGASGQGITRMSQVIEDSIRGNYERGNHRPTGATKDLEGLACPRTKSPYGRQDVMPQGRVNNGGHDYPVEGLAARFGNQRAFWQPPQGGPSPQDMAQQHSPYGRPPYGHPGYPPESYVTLKRSSSPPQVSPSLPPKKQHFDDYRGPKDLLRPPNPGFFQGFVPPPQATGEDLAKPRPLTPGRVPPLIFNTQPTHAWINSVQHYRA